MPWMLITSQPTAGTGFRSIKGPVESGDRFTVDHITYQVSNNIHSKTVGLMDYTGPGGVVTIPPTVDHGPNTFTVALIWIHSFRFANFDRGDHTGKCGNNNARSLS